MQCQSLCQGINFIFEQNSPPFFPHSKTNNSQMQEGAGIHFFELIKFGPGFGSVVRGTLVAQGLIQWFPAIVGMSRCAQKKKSLEQTKSTAEYIAVCAWGVRE